MNNTEKLAKLAINKSLLKEYSNSSNERIVYMNDGTEFQIQVFNPYSYVIGVSFEFNNHNNTSQLLVLRPGERVWLDRFLDNESKLLFSTYQVGASKEVQEAIKDNGNLCIKFYKERENKPQVSYTKIYQPYDWNAKPLETIDVYYSKIGNSYCLDNNSNINCASSANFCGAVDCSLSLDSSITQASAASTYTSCSSSASTKSKLLPKSKSIETGRIEKGSHSNQRFENVYKDFEYWPFKTEYIKILPTSQKQVNSNDLQKKYCHECGKKLNPKFKFCPSCGAKQ